ncbi:caspase family protein, partial [Leptolyngbya cf. ectocarpi LEGE 11479]
MSTCWAIIIGINQYQGFQPLMQAQNDAVGIRRYLIDDVGFAPENCILLSDLSTSIEQEAVYPDRMAINDWLETICQGRVQKDDTLWFYFSGYGAQADNRDYLMPVDGDPAQIKQTGIALQDVVKDLKQAPTKNVMMVLDINRSQSALAGQAIGTQVTKLARKARIPLILSCQPNEFSHETLAVRHGLFTAALLEGLRYDGCATLSHLERYLVERVPELCEHHWRPIQNPVVLLPEEQKFQLLWHQRETSAAADADPALVDPTVGADSQSAVNPDATDDGLESGGLIPDSPE